MKSTLRRGAVSLFDLLFMAAFLATVGTLIVAATLAMRRQGPRAWKILRGLAFCAAAYLLTGIVVSYLKPQRILAVGEPWCFDDWCLGVEKVSRTPAISTVSYRVDLRIFSRARRVSQRAKGAWVYLIDDRGRRYSPDPDPSVAPLDVLLRPGESVTTTRVFRVPPGIHTLGLITGHGGPYCGPMNILIIGGAGCLLGKPRMIGIP